MRKAHFARNAPPGPRSRSASAGCKGVVRSASLTQQFFQVLGVEDKGAQSDRGAGMRARQLESGRSALAHRPQRFQHGPFRGRADGFMIHNVFGKWTSSLPSPRTRSTIRQTVARRSGRPVRIATISHSRARQQMLAVQVPGIHSPVGIAQSWTAEFAAHRRRRIPQMQGSAAGTCGNSGGRGGRIRPYAAACPGRSCFAVRCGSVRRRRSRRAGPSPTC